MPKKKDPSKENSDDEANPQNPPLLSQPSHVVLEDKQEVKIFKAPKGSLSKKTPRGKSYEGHENSSDVDDPTKISTYVDTPEGMKPLGKYGEQGDDKRPEKGRRSIDFSRDLSLNKEKEDLVKAMAFVDFDTLSMMKQAEAFLECNEAREFVKEKNYGFNVHESRGERTAHVSKSQHKNEFKIVLIYAEAANKSEARKKVYVPESVIKELSKEQIRRVALNKSAANSAPTYILKAGEDQNTKPKYDPEIKPILKPKPRKS